MTEDKIHCFDFGEYRLDITNNLLLKNKTPVSITQRSFEILRLLIENRGRIVKKDELLDSLWEEDFVEESTLTQHIYMLRKILRQSDESDQYIETIPKNGYRFVAEVKERFFDKLPIRSSGRNQSLKEVHLRNGRPERTGGAFSPVARVGNWLAGGGKRSLSYLPGVAAVSFIFIFLAAGFFYFSRRADLQRTDAAKINSIVVLPFQQIGGEKDEKLGLGTADVLISKLGKFEGFTVLPTTAIIRYADERNGDLIEIGNKLKVDAVLTGTIQRDDDLVRVTVQLYDVGQKSLLWSEKFDESYSDIFSLQDKISEQVSDKLSLKLRGNEFVASYTRYTENTEAYQAYSMGLFYWSKHTSHGFKEAIGHFQRAIEKDPGFALAYAHLADTYAHFNHISDIISPEDSIRKARSLAEKALEIDPQCAEAMASLALTYVSGNQQSKAYQLLRRSLEINPNNANAHQRMAWLYANRGELEKSIVEMGLAHDLDRESTYITLSLAELLNLARRPDEAMAYTRTVLEDQPNSPFAKWRMAQSLEQKGEFKEAIKNLEDVLGEGREPPVLMLTLSRIYAKNHQPEKARSIIDRMISEGKVKDAKSLVSYVYASLGDTDKALKWLKESGIGKDVESCYILRFDPNLDPLREKPEFQEILAKLEAIRQT
ncbi:MAG: winged helix-turn-helix domain-containing protein [Pyrinomonadaceae bacterium]